MVLTDSPDMAYILEHVLTITQKIHISLSMVADSQSLFDLFTKATTCTTVNRLMIDFQTVKVAYKSSHVKNVTLFL